MTPLPPAANVLRARVLFTIAGKQTQGVRMFFKWSGTAPTATALNTLAETLYNLLVSEGLPGLMSPTTTLSGVLLEDLSSSLGAEGSHEANYEGTRSTNPLPADAAAVTSYEIPRRYRGGHPRSYWPVGTSKDLTTPDSFTAAFVEEVQAFITSVVAGFVGQSEGGTVVGNHVSVSYYEGFTAVENPLTHRYRNVPTLRATPVITDVTAIITRNYVGSFRRRRFKTS